VATVFGFMAWRLSASWRELPPGFFARVRWPTLLLSYLALLGALLLVSARWTLTLWAMGVSIRGWHAVRIWFLSQAGRYLPGGVWTYVGRYQLGRDRVPREALVASIALETGLRIVSEVLAFLLSLPFWPDVEFLGAGVFAILVSSVVVGIALLHPVVLSRVSSSALAGRLGLGPADLRGLGYGRVLGLLAYYVGTVVAVGGAFYLLVASFHPLPAQLLPVLTGSLSASMVLGFVVPIAPNGWGVREGLLVFFLGRILPGPVAIVLSAASRVWLMVGEATWIVAMVRLGGRQEPK
jgi:hypothetical protein